MEKGLKHFGVRLLLQKRGSWEEVSAKHNKQEEALLPTSLIHNFLTWEDVLQVVWEFASIIEMSYTPWSSPKAICKLKRKAHQSDKGDAVVHLQPTLPKSGVIIGLLDSPLLSCP